MATTTRYHQVAMPRLMVERPPSPCDLHAFCMTTPAALVHRIMLWSRDAVAIGSRRCANRRRRMRDGVLMTVHAEQSYVSVDDRRARGKEAAKRAPASSHSEWEPAADRPDPVELLVAQDAAREPDLVPVRHGRMMVTPFTFYRGAAKV